jgi:hypothetical protein
MEAGKEEHIVGRFTKERSQYAYVGVLEYN